MGGGCRIQGNWGCPISDLLDYHLGEEDLTVLGHVFLGSCVKIVSCELKPVFSRQLSHYIAYGDHREIICLCNIFKEEILACPVFANCCQYHLCYLRQISGITISISLPSSAEREIPSMIA